MHAGPSQAHRISLTDRFASPKRLACGGEVSIGQQVSLPCSPRAHTYQITLYSWLSVWILPYIGCNRCAFIGGPNCDDTPEVPKEIVIGSPELRRLADVVPRCIASHAVGEEVQTRRGDPLEPQ